MMWEWELLWVQVGGYMGMVFVDVWMLWVDGWGSTWIGIEVDEGFEYLCDWWFNDSCWDTTTYVLALCHFSFSILFRYVKLLMQEFCINLDKGFMMSIYDLFISRQTPKPEVSRRWWMDVSFVQCRYFINHLHCLLILCRLSAYQTIDACLSITRTFTQIMPGMLKELWRYQEADFFCTLLSLIHGNGASLHPVQFPRHPVHKRWLPFVNSDSECYISTVPDLHI